MKTTRMLWIMICSLLILSVFAAPVESRRPRPPVAQPTRLAAPTLISPANNTTVLGTITFEWSAVPGADCYHIQAHLNPYFDQQYNIIERWCHPGTSYTFTPSPGFIVYFPRLYWRVQAVDANHVGGQWSETRLVRLK